MNEKQLELWLSFWKIFLGTFVIGIVTAVINWQIQTREIDIKDREIIIKDKEAEFKEMERLGEFVDHALAENVAVRRRFSQYFSTVTRSNDLRERWKEYASLVETEYTAKEDKKAELEKIKDELLKASARGETVSAELEKVREDLAKTTSELEVTKNDKPNKIIPINLSKAIKAEMLFDLAKWESAVDIEVLMLYSKLSKEVLDPIIGEFEKLPIFIRNKSAPKLDDNGRIYVTFELENIPYEKLACWVKDNTDFDEIKRYFGLYEIFGFFTEKGKAVISRSHLIRIYYKNEGNRKRVPKELTCVNPNNKTQPTDKDGG